MPEFPQEERLLMKSPLFEIKPCFTANHIASPLMQWGKSTSVTVHPTYYSIMFCPSRSSKLFAASWRVLCCRHLMSRPIPIDTSSRSSSDPVESDSASNVRAPPGVSMSISPDSKQMFASQYAAKFDDKNASLLRNALQIVQNPVKPGSYEIKSLGKKLDFDKGLFCVVRAIQLLRQHNQNRAIIVGCAGPSGAGKSSLCSKLKEFIPELRVISMDMYMDASKVVDENFDDFRSLDFPLLNKNLEDLSSGRGTELPVYDFKTSSRTGYRTMDSGENAVIVVDGIYALHPDLRHNLDLRVSISGGVHFDLVKRVIRDIQRTGQTPKEALTQISETVYPMFKAFIEPDLKTAHIRIVNTFNPFAGFLNPTYILKSDVTPSRETVLEVMSGKPTTTTTEETIDIYLYPPGVDPEGCQDWFRLRNAGGVYTLMFSEWIKEGDFIISPRVDFEVSVRILSGLMALGYQIGAIQKRKSENIKSDDLTISFDFVEQLGQTYIQIKGMDRETVKEAGQALKLDGSYIPKSYIELMQHKHLMHEFKGDVEEFKSKIEEDVKRSGLASPFMSPTNPPKTAAFAMMPNLTLQDTPSVLGVDGNTAELARSIDKLEAKQDEMGGTLSRLEDNQRKLDAVVQSMDAKLDGVVKMLEKLTS